MSFLIANIQEDIFQNSFNIHEQGPEKLQAKF